MRTTQSAFQHDILIVEQAAMVGGIIVSTARQLKLPGVRLATSVRAAQLLLEQHTFSALIVSLNEEGPALELVQNLRGGKYRTLADAPIAVTATACGVELAQLLRGFFVRRILLKPFKVRDVVLTIGMLDNQVEAK